MTKEEFIKQYTSGMTEEQITEWFLKFKVMPCNCEEDGCSGWGMFLRDVPIRINLTTSQKNPNA